MQKKMAIVIILVLAIQVVLGVDMRNCPTVNEFDESDYSACNAEQIAEIKDQSVIDKDQLNTIIKREFGTTSNFVIIKGTTIDSNGILKAPDGSTINLKEFKGTHNVVITADKVTIGKDSFKGAEIKTDVNGVLIIPKTTKAEKPAEPKKPAVAITNGEGGEVGPDHWYFDQGEKGEVTDTTTGTTTTFTNFQNLRIKTNDAGTTVSVGHSDSTTIGSSNIIDVNDFLLGTDFTYSFDSAEEFSLGDIHLSSLCKSEFDVKGNALISAKLCSDIDNNVFIFPNPIPITTHFYIYANKSKTIDLDYTKLVVENNVPKLALGFRLDKGIVVNFTTSGIPAVKLKSKENDARISIIQYGVTNFEFNDIELECNQHDFSETVDTTKKSKAGLNMQECLGYVILSPTSSPGGKYNYDDKKIKERSFGLYNRGKEPYEVGFKKTQQFFDWREFEKIKDGYSFGYVDFTNHTFSLNSEIELLKYPDKPTELSTTDYFLFPVSYMKTIFISENNNTASIKFEPNLVMIKNIHIINQEPISTTRNGIFELHEPNRYLIPRHDLNYPEKVEHYMTSYYKPEISIIDRTLDMDKVKVHKALNNRAKELIKDTYTILTLEQWLAR